jgi:deoxyadenosine/deoxycytidine kinase
MEERSKTERLARTIVADFFLYNQDMIDRGLLNDNLFEILKGELEDSVSYFKERSDGDLTIFWDTLFNRLMQREAKLLENRMG